MRGKGASFSASNATLNENALLSRLTRPHRVSPISQLAVSLATMTTAEATDAAAATANAAATAAAAAAAATAAELLLLLLPRAEPRLEAIRRGCERPHLVNLSAGAMHRCEWITAAAVRS